MKIPSNPHERRQLGFLTPREAAQVISGWSVKSLDQAPEPSSKALGHIVAACESFRLYVRQPNGWYGPSFKIEDGALVHLSNIEEAFPNLDLFAHMINTCGDGKPGPRRSKIESWEHAYVWIKFVEKEAAAGRMTLLRKLYSPTAKWLEAAHRAAGRLRRGQHLPKNSFRLNEVRDEVERILVGDAAKAEIRQLYESSYSIERKPDIAIGWVETEIVVRSIT